MSDGAKLAIALFVIGIVPSLFVLFGGLLMPSEPGAKAGELLAIGVGIVGYLFFVPIYFIPTIVAVLRGHRNALPIFVINMLAAWTVLAWVICLAWAFSTDAYGP